MVGICDAVDFRKMSFAAAVRPEGYRQEPITSWIRHEPQSHAKRLFLII
jgi:hypothetical protein